MSDKLKSLNDHEIQDIPEFLKREEIKKVSPAPEADLGINEQEPPFETE